MGDSEKASRSRRTEDDCLSAELNNEFSEACQQTQNAMRIQITYHDNMDDGAVYNYLVFLSELVRGSQNQLGLGSLKVSIPSLVWGPLDPQSLDPIIPDSGSLSDDKTMNEKRFIMATVIANQDPLTKTIGEDDSSIYACVIVPLTQTILLRQNSEP